MGRIEDFLSDKFINSRVYEHLKVLMEQYREVFEGVEWKDEVYEKKLDNKIINYDIYEGYVSCRITMNDNRLFNYYWLSINPDNTITFNIYGLKKEEEYPFPFNTITIGLKDKYAWISNCNCEEDTFCEASGAYLVYRLTGELERFITFDKLQHEQICKLLEENGLEIADSLGNYEDSMKFFKNSKMYEDFANNPKCKFKVRKKENN